MSVYDETFVTLLKSNKYPLIITLVFFLTISYITIFHHHYWFESDGIYYFLVGQEILDGNGKNIFVPNSPDIGTIVYATVNLIIEDGFLTFKIISLLSGTGIVFFSYYITKNIFSTRIALIVQLFVACNPRLDLASVYAMNELLPVFLIFTSLYFITKKSLKLSDLVMSGALLGVSSLIRFQGLLVLISLLVFLLIRSNKMKINLSYFFILALFFIVTFSPMIFYNYSTHGNIIDTNSNFRLLESWVYQTSDWRNQVEQNVVIGKSEGILLDPVLFLKNYFYNLFYANPDKLFNFNSINNFSLIPIIPYLGIIPVLGGLMYLMRANMNKINIITLLATGLTTTFFVFLFGDITIHFFAIPLVPVLFVGMLNIRKFPENLLPLLISSVIVFLILSIAPVGKADHLFAMWIIIPILSSIFFIKVIPSVFSKIKFTNYFKKEIIEKVSISLIILLLVLNIIFSIFLLYYSLYENAYFDFESEYSKLFEKKDFPRENGFEILQISNILSKQHDIQNSYIMASGISVAYYTDSKFVYAQFQEGVKNDSLNSYVTRENWNQFDRFVSNITSLPIDKFDVNNPIPDYLIYAPLSPNAIDPWKINNTQFEDLKFLTDPDDPRIPANFEILFKSNVTGTVVYKIHHNEDVQTNIDNIIINKNQQ